MPVAGQIRSPEEDPLASYHYVLPQGLIAQAPARRRVQARMMVLPPEGGDPRHRKVADLPKWLKAGDILVLNDTKVVPARLQAEKPTGGKVEILFLNPAMPLKKEANGFELHEALLKSHRPVKPGARLRLPGRTEAWVECLERGERGKAVLRVSENAVALAENRGQVPLPPYIKRPQGPNESDRRRYQTVYANRPGAVAAPTAGLHLSPGLLSALLKRGVNIARITLHVGYGTFAEPSAEDLAKGRLHAEWVEISQKTAEQVNQAKAAGGRVIPVGTTSMRALEWLAEDNGILKHGRGWCDLLISPGRPFRIADGMMTNFHLPRTTLLMLVAALAGKERVMAAYRLAVKEKYRFYSFGDAMLIL